MLSDQLAMAGGGAHGLYARGMARFKACDFSQALEDFERALAINPEFTDARFMRAQVLENRDVATALAEYDALLAAQPEQPTVHMARAGLRRATGDLLGAMADYQAIEALVRNASRTTPWRLRVARERALLYEAMGFNLGAAADYEFLANHDSADRALHHRQMERNRGRQHWKAGRFAEAAKTFDGLVRAARDAGEQADPVDLMWRYLAAARVDHVEADIGLLRDRPPLETAHAIRTAKPGAAPDWNQCGPPCPVARWPQPVFDLMCGRLSPEEFSALCTHALAASDTWRPPASFERTGRAELRVPPHHLWRAEVEFYLGQWHLLHNYRFLALKHLEAAAADLRARCFESHAAAAELARAPTGG